MGDFTGRIDQLDAIDLDKELGQHFNGQLKEAVKYLPEIWLVKILPELEVILELSFHYLTFFSNKSSVGQKLLGLRIKERVHSRLESQFAHLMYGTLARTHSIRGLKSRVLKLIFLA